MKLNETEKTWLVQLLTKKAALANMPENKKREPKLCKVIGSLQKKVVDGVERFTRNELHVLKKLVEHHIAFAMNNVIPEYEARIAKPKIKPQPGKWKKNIEIVKKKVEMLEALLIKIQEEL